MALGADRGGVQRMVVWRVAILVSAGALVGTVISLWAAQFVGSLLYGLEPRDPLTIARAAALLAAVALGAAWLPARHASHIDPSVVLREG
jgi:ABC-type antimicrobial peptide transport system permease subunit